MTDEIDLITFEVIKNRLDSIADQMALVLMQSAYSPIVRDSLDYSTAICDRHGGMVAQGLTTALHLGSFPHAMRNLMAHHGGRMRPGDVFLLNDPYGAGGMHLPDIYVIRPVFHNEEVEGFATVLVHHADVGGIAPGSIAVHATEIYQEGIRLPLLKLYDGGVLNETLVAILEKNVRVPRLVLGDLRAQIAASNRGEQEFHDLLAHYGSQQLRHYLNAIQENAEQRMRAEISRLPDGAYHFTDFIDGLGEHPEPLRFQLCITISGDRAIADWTGTAGQVRAAINAPGPFIYSATYLGFRCLCGPGMPNAEGYMRPIELIVPERSIVSPVLPAAANARGVVGFRAFDTVLGALAKAAPGRIPAAGEGGATNFGVGGHLADGPYVFAETLMGAWGGRADCDGIDGAANLAANQSNQPIELIEADNPVEILRYGFVANSGGPGKFRGGLAILREYRIQAQQGMMTFRTDRRRTLPYGLAGGSTGTPSLNILNPGPDSRVLPVLPMQGYEVGAGDVFCHVLAGAGGFGAPLERDPAAVREDVLDGKITADYARSQYGVVLTATANAVDDPATDALRAAFRQTASPDGHLAAFADTLAGMIGFEFPDIDRGPA